MVVEQKNSIPLFFVQGKAFSASPAQKLEEVQAGVEDLVVFEHHFVKCVNWKVTIGISVFECGHGGVESVCLMAERGIVHGDDLEGMLEKKNHRIKNCKPEAQTTHPVNLWLSNAIPLQHPQQSAQGFRKFGCSSSNRCL